MFKIKGKYNTANVYQDKNLVEVSCINQIQTLLSQPFTKNETIRIMPDCHTGKGVCIGYTQTLHTKKVCPSLVGVDIGCGVITIKLGKEINSLEELDNVIRNNIPSGTNICKSPTIDLHFEDFKCGNFIENKDRILCSIGTLGGGNHFIEIDKNSKQEYYLLIHTGSRNLGVQIAEYYQNLAYEKQSSFLNKYHKESIALMIEDYKANGWEKDIPSMLKDMKENAPIVDKKYAFLMDEDFDNYIHDMKLCQEYAEKNRKKIANIILDKWLGKSLEDFEYFETVHNYIDTDSMVLRKGSVNAEKGRKLIIPINMAEGSLICKGKGYAPMNYSAPHGAGRIMSRNEAKNKISIDDFKKSMEGIFTTCIGKDTIDEAPQAYKTLDNILPNIKNTVSIKEIIKPVYNFKAKE